MWSSWESETLRSKMPRKNCKEKLNAPLAIKISLFFITIKFRRNFLLVQCAHCKYNWFILAFRLLLILLVGFAKPTYATSYRRMYNEEDEKNCHLNGVRLLPGCLEDIMQGSIRNLGRGLVYDTTTWCRSWKLRTLELTGHMLKISVSLRTIHVNMLWSWIKVRNHRIKPFRRLSDFDSTPSLTEIVLILYFNLR